MESEDTILETILNSLTPDVLKYLTTFLDVAGKLNTVERRRRAIPDLINRWKNGIRITDRELLTYLQAMNLFSIFGIFATLELKDVHNLNITNREAFIAIYFNYSDDDINGRYACEQYKSIYIKTAKGFVVVRDAPVPQMDKFRGILTNNTICKLLEQSIFEEFGSRFTLEKCVITFDPLLYTAVLNKHVIGKIGQEYQDERQEAIAMVKELVLKDVLEKINIYNILYRKFVTKVLSIDEKILQRYDQLSSS